MDRNGDVDRRSLFKLLIAFWIVFIVLFAVRTLTESWDSRIASLIRRVPMAMIGAGLCWGMYLILRKVDPRGALGRFFWVAGLSAPIGCLFAVINSLLFYFVTQFTVERCGGGKPCTPEFLTMLAVEYSVNFTFIFVAWGALYLGMRGNALALAAERNAGAAREEARVAQLRALRYQVNPHFLFNCLNSLNTLIDRDDPAAARSMIGQLSSFLRYGLSTDPLADVELDDEVEMQRRYLDIERVRFSNRLAVDFDIAPRARRALVPSLILQPLVENAIKHGVARSSAPVTISIRASLSDDARLLISVHDNAPGAAGAGEVRLGIGLSNVSERLRARFGADAGLSFEASANGFRVDVLMPLVRA